MAMGLVRVAGLLAIAALAGDEPRSPRDRLAAIEADQQAASARYADDPKRAGTSSEQGREAVDRYVRAVEENVRRALALADEHPKDPVAYPALQFVIRTNRAGPGDGSARALRRILDRDLVRVPGQAAYLPHVALTLTQYPDAAVLLGRMLDENPARDDRAAAAYWLAQHRKQQAKVVRFFREQPERQAEDNKPTAAQPLADFLRENDPAAREDESRILLERVAAEFGDIRLPGERRDLGEIVAGELFALNHLAVGKIAPEIEGTDHEGKPLRLGDYRGKVVVVTFSGNWCGPCVAMYPQERALVSAHKDRPFALLSVSTDADVATLRKSIADGEITWPCWWDGTAGPIVTRWGIAGFPSIFVLDRRGVIRHKNLRGDALDRAVSALLDEDSARQIGIELRRHLHNGGIHGEEARVRSSPVGPPEVLATDPATHEQNALAIAREVCQCLSDEGFEPDWGGIFSRKIGIHLNWQRRTPLE